MRIGILGAGQLGALLALSALRSGHDVIVLSDVPSECCAFLGEMVQLVSFDDRRDAERFYDKADVWTYEFENIPATFLEAMLSVAPVVPTVQALECFSDRKTEKEFLQSLSIPVADFIVPQALQNTQALQNIEHFVSDSPAICKTRRLGYDGKGQFALDIGASAQDIEQKFFEHCDLSDSIVERRVAFDAEYSLVGAIDSDGNVVTLPLARNYHQDGILRFSVPVMEQFLQGDGVLARWLGAGLGNHSLQGLQAKAHDYFGRIARELRYCGVLAVEFFFANGGLLANECAPRVHNSGHWSLDGCVLSQFDLHIHAISGGSFAGCPDTMPALPVAMVNIIGHHLPQTLLERHAWLKHYDYCKSERAGRKLGHLNVLTSDLEAHLGQLINDEDFRYACQLPAELSEHA